jgi:hypothetical protein
VASRHAGFFLSDEKKDSSFSEEKEAKRLLFLVLRRFACATPTKWPAALCHDAFVSGFAVRQEQDEPEHFAALYRRAFEHFGKSALWSSVPVPDPTPEDALAITRTLRVEGDLRARRLAEQIEHACHRAAH